MHSCLIKGCSNHARLALTYSVFGNSWQVVSEKDQAQYWRHKDRTYNFISPSMFARMFKELPMGKTLYEELARPFEKTEFHRSALSFEIYSFKKWELLKACLSREWLLMKRNSFFHVFKSAQVIAHWDSECAVTIHG